MIENTNYSSSCSLFAVKSIFERFWMPAISAPILLLVRLLRTISVRRSYWLLISLILETLSFSYSKYSPLLEIDIDFITPFSCMLENPLRWIPSGEASWLSSSLLLCLLWCILLRLLEKDTLDNSSGLCSRVFFLGLKFDCFKFSMSLSYVADFGSIKLSVLFGWDAYFFLRMYSKTYPSLMFDKIENRLCSLCFLSGF